ncbi:uncharacterized mitochondrial protein-like protein [Tanacetum coccineum]
MHQAPRAWYETLSIYLLDNGFQRGKIYKTLFIRRDKGDILLVQVYVDDIIFGSIKKSLCTEFEKMMHKKFQMSSMGELTFFLRLQVKQKEDGIFISQDKYVTEILKKFGFTDVKTASTPMETQKLLLKDEDGEEVDVHLYRSMIGSLMYLTSSRPDIMFAVCACARYQVNPKVSHLHAVKRIFRYLKGQPKLGLWYPKDSPFDLVAYTDSDYAGASLDRKSTTGVDEVVLKERGDSLVRAATTASSLEAEHWPQAPRHHGDTIAQTRFENVSKTSNDSLLAGVNTPRSDKDNCSSLGDYKFETESQEVREERRGQKNSRKDQKFYHKVVDLQEWFPLMKLGLGGSGVASKQGGKLKTLIRCNASYMDRIWLEKRFNVAEKELDIAHSSYYCGERVYYFSGVKSAKLPTTTAATTITAVSTRPRAKGLVIHEQEQAPTLTVSSQQPSQLNVQDKYRLASEKDQQIEEANIVSWDNVQAMIDADYQMAQQMQAEEQEKFSIKEKSKLFVQLLEARKKHFAAIRAKEKRNKPPTKAQKRNTMSTYLKNMVGYKHN